MTTSLFFLSRQGKNLYPTLERAGGVVLEPDVWRCHFDLRRKDIFIFGVFWWVEIDGGSIGIAVEIENACDTKEVEPTLYKLMREACPINTA